MIAHREPGLRFVTLHRDLHRRALRSMADGVPHDVLHRAAQQFLEARHLTWIAGQNRHSPIADACFEIRVGRDFLHQVGEIEGAALHDPRRYRCG